MISLKKKKINNENYLLVFLFFFDIHEPSSNPSEAAWRRVEVMKKL